MGIVPEEMYSSGVKADNFGVDVDQGRLELTVKR